MNIHQKLYDFQGAEDDDEGFRYYDLMNWFYRVIRSFVVCSTIYFDELFSSVYFVFLSPGRSLQFLYRSHKN